MMIQENTRTAASGYLALVVLPVLTLLFGWLIIRYGPAGSIVLTGLYMVGLLATLICFKGLFMVHPNQAKVLQLFGSYVGSVRQDCVGPTRFIPRNRYLCGFVTSKAAR
jgi:hypothetical protein